MRIEDVDNKSLKKVFVSLTTDEASELRDTLDGLLKNRKVGPEHHEHVSSSDFGTELSIWIEDAK